MFYGFYIAKKVKAKGWKIKENRQKRRKWNYLYKMIWEKVTEQMPDVDFVRQVKVSGKNVCLIREQGKYYAVQNNCPHAGGTLSGGWCKNGHLICPVHRWEYSLETGRGATGQGDYIDLYKVEQRADGLYVGLKESWWKRLWR